MPRTHLIVSTHTRRHLRWTLLGAALQGDAAASVTLSIDNDRSEVRELARECSNEFDLPLTIVHRPWPEEVRVGQVRNNGVRALLSLPETLAPAPDDLLYFLDGDAVAPRGMIARADEMVEGFDLLIGGRVLLTEAQTASFDKVRLQKNEGPADPCTIDAAQWRRVNDRHRRYLCQLRLKPFGLVKVHKPKVLGASHGATLRMYERVNGYDESYLGAWREDDDFGRRVYLAGGRARVAVRDLCVYHLWHPLNPKKRENWSEIPGGGSGPEPWRCAEGLSSPRPQSDLHVERIVGGRVVDESMIPQTPLPGVTIIAPQAGAADRAMNLSDEPG